MSKARDSQPLGVEIRGDSDHVMSRVCVVRMSALRRFLQAECSAMQNRQNSPWVIVVREQEMDGQEG